MPYAYAVSSIAVFLFAGIWLIGGSWDAKWERLRNSPLPWLFMAVYLMEVAGLLYTRNIPNGLFVLQKKVLILAFPILLASVPPLSVKQVRLLLAAFVATCLAGSFVCLVQGLYHAFVLSRPESLFYHELAAFIGMQGIYLSVYVGFSVLVLVYCLLFEPAVMSPSLRRAAAFLSAYLIGFMVLLSVRTALAAIILLLTILLLTYFYKRRRFVTGVLSIAGMILITAALIYVNPVSSKKFREAFDQNETILLNNQQDQSLGRDWGGKALRIAIWQCTIGVIDKNFWLGVGTGSTQDALQEGFKERNFDFAYLYNRYNAHNQYLETWVGLGVTGLMVLLLSQAVPLYLSFRTGNYIYALHILFFAINCLTESMLERQKGVIFYTFFNALLAFHLPRKQTAMRSGPAVSE